MSFFAKRPKVGATIKETEFPAPAPVTDVAPDAAEEALPVPEPETSNEERPTVVPGGDAPDTVLISYQERGSLEVGDLYGSRKIVRIDEMAGSFQLTLE